MARNRDWPYPGTSINDVSTLLSELSDADVELLAPPEDLWQDIQAAIGAVGPKSSPRSAPERDLSAGAMVEYRIDGTDTLIDVGGDWADEARRSGTPELVAPDPQRSFWSQIEGREVRQLWQLLVQRVRRSQQPVQVPLRCDAPDARRWMEMTLTPEPDGVIHFSSRLVFEQARPRLDVLDGDVERDCGADPIELCSWCGLGRSGSDWVEIEEVSSRERLLERSSPPPLSHGVCSACHHELSTELATNGELETGQG